ncbi:DNA helicase PIF1, ATP-dependent [Senna tora]|uniref:ATP-dependent DNA helicase n=1 Tax=Senna tora TaxID=362788 RepID=A0A834X7J1_9FABA|nr:DNA helicase PIF1, ATP-dependent [Senna tora]
MPTFECEFCGALLWFEERVNKAKRSMHPKFSLCCMQGNVVLPPVKRLPKLLERLFTRKDPRSAEFMREIRNYNNMFVFTSMGGKIDYTVNNGKGPYVFRLHGQNMHLIGSLLPCNGERPKFSQLYIYDTDNEVSNCQHNARSSNDNNLRLKLIRKRHSDVRTYNLPTASEVATLIVGDFGLDKGERDIIIEHRSGLLQRIDKLHQLYLPMQYLLLFPCGEDGYREETLYRDGSISANGKQRTLTLRRYFAYKLQERHNDFIMILRGEKLSQQFIVDAFTMIEAQRAAFVRYKPEDRPDMLARIFKIKLNMMIKDITREVLFGKCRAFIYTIEFQKLGLPHAHILLWLALEDKFSIASQIDYVIFTEIPNPHVHPVLYEAVKALIHGTCGASRLTSPCIMNGKCTKHFPKKFTDRTLFDEDGYAKYRCRDTGHSYIELVEIENNLRTNGRSLHEFPPMPLPNATLLANMGNSLVSEELNYDRQLLLAQHSTLFTSLTVEQSNIYYLIMDCVNLQHGGVFFVNGFGGSGRTFIWNTLTSARGRGDIVLAVASSGITSQLIPGETDLANLLPHTKLIIWDEAPMTHRNCFKVLDKSLKDICSKDNPECHRKPFGGKVVVFGGNFRQILPVIPRGSWQDIVLSLLNSSYIWDSCKVLTLTKNIRLGTRGNETENRAISEFSDWILKIGDGDIGDILNNEEKEINIPNDILLNNTIDPIHSIVVNTYPSFIDNYHDHDYIKDRAMFGTYT